MCPNTHTPTPGHEGKEVGKPLTAHTCQLLHQRPPPDLLFKSLLPLVHLEGWLILGAHESLGSKAADARRALAQETGGP